MSVSPFLKYQTLDIARGLAPIDTGNLRYNAIKIINIKENSWTITYSLDNAYYIEYLEDGTINMRSRKFIENTAQVLASYLVYRLNGNTSRYMIKLQARSILENQESDARVERNLQSLNRASSLKNGVYSSVGWK